MILAWLRAGLLAFGARIACGYLLFTFLLQVLESSVLLLVFLAALLFSTGPKSLYVGLLHRLRARAPVEDSNPVSA